MMWIKGPDGHWMLLNVNLVKYIGQIEGHNKVKVTMLDGDILELSYTLQELSATLLDHHL